jgi:hypothetical protein
MDHDGRVSSVPSFRAVVVHSPTERLANSLLHETTMRLFIFPVESIFGLLPHEQNAPIDETLQERRTRPSLDHLYSHTCRIPLAEQTDLLTALSWVLGTRWPSSTRPWLTLVYTCMGLDYGYLKSPVHSRSIQDPGQ